jgi:hypothetical protein
MKRRKGKKKCKGEGIEERKVRRREEEEEWKRRTESKETRGRGGVEEEDGK